jgi:hypothetical protein
VTLRKARAMIGFLETLQTRPHASPLLVDYALKEIQLLRTRAASFSLQAAV